jgi:predicted ATPase
MLVEKTRERVYEAELFRFRGELLLARLVEADPEAEICFQQALDMARRQHAKSLELRTAMSLSRLWLRQGKEVEARQLLAAVYNWFTEGFEMADLQEARTLLAKLA